MGGVGEEYVASVGNGEGFDGLLATLFRRCCLSSDCTSRADLQRDKSFWTLAKKEKKK